VVSASTIQIEQVSTSQAFEKFASFPFDVYGAREAWWPPDLQSEVDLLSGRSPLSPHIDLTPFWARRSGRIVARVSAVVNHRYNQHWNEKVGQLIHFEALPGERDAALSLLEETSQSLKSKGMKAARSGFAAFLDYPYAVDNYGEFPPFLLRASPAYYHSYFKEAGFETEKGLTDYTAPLTSEILRRYRAMLDGVAAAGIRIENWRDYGFLAAVDAWTDVTNAAFERHWGWNPISRDEVRPMLSSLAETEVAEFSVVAVAGGQPIGAVFSVPDFSLALAHLRPGRLIRPDRGGGSRGALINIGVLKKWRGRGVGVAMAALSYLAMAHRNLRFAGYTLVLDDNWPSRRTAERLGACVTSNFVAYRREL
jgi:GNAT superfamily N-acetyltransferase